jgi:hypothetical protein
MTSQLIFLPTSSPQAQPDGYENPKPAAVDMDGLPVGTTENGRRQKHGDVDEIT